MIHIWTINTGQISKTIESPIKRFIKRIRRFEFKSDLNSIVVKYSFNVGYTSSYIIVPNTVTRHRIVDASCVSLNLACTAASIIVFDVTIITLLPICKNSISTFTFAISVDIYIVAAHANTCMAC